MADRIKLQQIWDRSHREKPASEPPEDDIVVFAEYLQKCLAQGASLLDAGCGRGRNAVHLSRLGFSVCGCDLSPVALRVAKERTGRAGLLGSFQVSDLICLPYADHSFAAAICVHVLPYHLKDDIPKCIYELWRVVRPNGWLYVDFLDCDDAEYACGSQLEAHTFLDPDGAPTHFSSWREISDLMKRFTLERAVRKAWKSSSGRVRVAWAIWAVKPREK